MLAIDAGLIKRSEYAVFELRPGFVIERVLVANDRVVSVGEIAGVQRDKRRHNRGNKRDFRDAAAAF